MQTYDLQPFTFAVAAAGELKVSIPQTSVTLLDVNGGFFLSLSEDEEVLYATGSTIYGQATGLIIIRTGAEGETAGVAGLLTVGKSEGLDIPGIGSLFSISGSVTIAFNTTGQDQTFTVPQMFVPILPAGAPTTITVFGAQPGLDGQPAGNPAGPYLQATVQAQITIGGVLTMNGFIQITAGVFGSGANAVADLQLVGAVGTTIPFLGALSGEINLTVILGAHPGVVGRAELALGSNQIPGVQFQGQFLLEINTFGAQKSVHDVRHQPRPPTALAASCRAPTAPPGAPTGSSPTPRRSAPAPTSTSSWAATSSSAASSTSRARWPSPSPSAAATRASACWSTARSASARWDRSI